MHSTCSGIGIDYFSWVLALEADYCPWIRTAGSGLRPKPWSFPQRVLTDYLLILVEDGREWVSCRGEQHELSAGDAYLLPPGVVTDKGCDSWSRPSWIHFDLISHPRRAEAPVAPCNNARLSPERRPWLQPSPRAIYGRDLPLLVPAPLLPRFRHEIPRIIAAWRSPRPTDVLRAHQALAELMLLFVEQIAEAPSSADAAIARAEEVARRSLDADFDVAAFAAAAGLSPSRFHERYKRLRGITPLRFLTEARMARARELLRDPQLPITSIAALVGHPDPTVFGRIFRREHGLSPSAWRASHMLN